MFANPSGYGLSLDASADYMREHPYAPSSSSRPAPACPSSTKVSETSLRTSQWKRFDRSTNSLHLTNAGGPPLSSVIRREVMDANTGELIHDESPISVQNVFIPGPPRDIITTLTFVEATAPEPKCPPTDSTPTDGDIAGTEVQSHIPFTPPATEVTRRIIEY